MNNKQNGNSYERAVVRKIAKYFNLVSYNGKNIEDCDIATTRAVSKRLDDMGIDVWFSPTLKKVFTKLGIQTKRTTKSEETKTFTIPITWHINRTELLKKKGYFPVLISGIYTKNKKGRSKLIKELVTIEIKDFLKIYKDANSKQLLRKEGSSK